jgi:hypothetical protein
MSRFADTGVHQFTPCIRKQTKHTESRIRRIYRLNLRHDSANGPLAFFGDGVTLAFPSHDLIIDFAAALTRRINGRRPRPSYQPVSIS